MDDNSVRANDANNTWSCTRAIGGASRLGLAESAHVAALGRRPSGQRSKYGYRVISVVLDHTDGVATRCHARQCQKDSPVGIEFGLAVCCELQHRLGKPHWDSDLWLGRSKVGEHDGVR